VKIKRITHLANVCVESYMLPQSIESDNDGINYSKFLSQQVCLVQALKFVKIMP